MGELEVTPDIIIRHGDPIAICYSSSLGIGLFRNYGNTLKYYDVWFRHDRPNFNSSTFRWTHKYIDDLKNGKPPRISYIYGPNVKQRVIPINIEIYKGTDMYEVYEFVKKAINEH